MCAPARLIYRKLGLLLIGACGTCSVNPASTSSGPGDGETGAGAKADEVRQSEKANKHQQRAKRHQIHLNPGRRAVICQGAIAFVVAPSFNEAKR